MSSNAFALQERGEGQEVVQPTDVSAQNYFHKVVDCDGGGRQHDVRRQEQWRIRAVQATVVGHGRGSQSKNRAGALV